MEKFTADEEEAPTEVFLNMDTFELLNDSSAFACSLRLQFPKFSKGFSSSDFDSFVKDHVGEDNLISLGRLSFPNEWQMQVTSKGVRENLIRMGKTKINSRTCWITPLSQSEIRGYIHWIPTAVDNSKLKRYLTAYGEVLMLENYKNTKWTLKKVVSESRYFGLYLKSGKTMDDVPHFIKIEGFLGLITIRGRKPCCFHCREVGHKKQECKKFREKIKSYCLRDSGTAFPRYHPRGKRYTKKRAGQKAQQENQTGTETITCEECRKEAAEAAKAAAMSATAAKAAGVDIPKLSSDASVGTDRNAGTASVLLGPSSNSKIEKLTSDLKEQCQSFLDQNLSIHKAVGMKAPPAVAESGNTNVISSPVLASVAVAEGQEVKEQAFVSGPLNDLEQLQKSVDEVIMMTKQKVDKEIQFRREVLLQQETEKNPQVEPGKKKRKKKKKKSANTETN